MTFTTKTLYELMPQSELLGQYGNITVYTDPTTITIGGLSILLLPWICDDNREKSLRAVAESSASVAMGHLEANGFEAHPGPYDV